MDNLRVDLSNAKNVFIQSKDDLIQLLKSGEVVVFNTRTGKYETKLYGVPLPNVEQVLKNVVSKRTSL